MDSVRVKDVAKAFGEVTNQSSHGVVIVPTVSSDVDVHYLSGSSDARNPGLFSLQNTYSTSVARRGR